MKKIREMSEKQFLAALERHGIGAPNGMFQTVCIPAPDGRGGSLHISMMNYFDGRKVHYRAALADILKKKDDYYNGEYPYGPKEVDTDASTSARSEILRCEQDVA